MLKPEDLNWLSDKLSDRTRTLAGMVIGIWWGALIGEGTGLAAVLKTALIGPVFAAAIAIFLDFLQYVVAYFMTWSVFRAAEGNVTTTVYSGPRFAPETPKEITFNTKWFSYRARNWLFALKQVAAAVAVGWFILIVWRQL